jgi:hypothetical protein
VSAGTIVVSFASLWGTFLAVKRRGAWQPFQSGGATATSSVFPAASRARARPSPRPRRARPARSKSTLSSVGADSETTTPK